MPVLTTVAVTTVASYLLGKMAGGAMQEAGKGLYHKIKASFTSDREKELLEQLEKQLEKQPENQRLQGKIELLLENKLENDQTLQKVIADLTDIIGKTGNSTQPTTNWVHHSPGAVTGSQIQAGGDVILGGSKKEG